MSRFALKTGTLRRDRAHDMMEQVEMRQAKLHVGKILIHFCDRIPKQKGNDDPLRQRLANEVRAILSSDRPCN